MRRLLSPAVENLTGGELQAEIKRILTDTGLFSSLFVSTDTEESRDIIKIDVEEIFSLIPLPFVAYADDVLTGGIFVIDSNFRGDRRFLVTGTTFSAHRIFALAALANPQEFDKEYGSGLTFALIDRTQGPSSMSIALSLSRETESSVRFFLSPRLALGSRGSLFRDPEPLFFQGLLTVGLEFDQTEARGVFRSGFKGSLAAAPGIVSSDNFYNQQLFLDLSLGETFGSRQHLELYSRVEYELSESVFLMERGGRRAERTLSRNSLRTSFVSSLDINYQYTFWSGRLFAATLLAFFEAGVYADKMDAVPFSRDFNLVPFYGPGTGFRLYFLRAAVPAMGLDAGYNLNTRDLAVSFSIGFVM